MVGNEQLQAIKSCFEKLYIFVNNNSSFQNYTNPDDHTQQTIYIFN